MKINKVNTGVYTGILNKAKKAESFREDKFIKSEDLKEDAEFLKPPSIKTRSEEKDITGLADYNRGLAIAAGSVLVASPIAEALKTIDIIYTNDIHGAINPMKDDKNHGFQKGGVSYMGTLIKQLKNESPHNHILLDGGDWGQGSYESKLTKGKTMIEVMNTLGYDAGEVGNHEFDWGREALKDMMKEATFPILGANILEDGNLIEGVTPYIIKEVNGFKIGILGLISQETSGTVDPKNITGLTFASVKETAEKYIPEMKEKGAELIFVLSHQGDGADERLAKSVRGIDVIVGGHSHTLIEEGRKVNDTIIVQAGTQGEKVGNLKLEVDPETKKVVSFKNNLISVNDKDLKPDPEIEKIIAPVVNESKEKMSEIVGKTEVDLTHNRSKVLESVMGNVLTDAMRESVDADVAMQNSGGIRDQIMKGPITMGDLYRVLPFDKFIVTMDLTGKQIKELMENSAQRKKGNMQVSGIKMDIDPTKPRGDMVSNIKIKDLPLDMNKVYRVATDDFLAGGANGYTTFRQGKNIEYGELVIDHLKGYVQKYSPLTKEKAKIEGRLNFIKREA